MAEVREDSVRRDAGEEERKEDTGDMVGGKEEGHLVLPFSKTFQEPYGLKEKMLAPESRHAPCNEVRSALTLTPYSCVPDTLTSYENASVTSSCLALGFLLS